MAKILIKNYENNAGKWIYNGFASAWESLEYEVERYDEFPIVNGSGKQLMTTSGEIPINNINCDFIIDNLAKYDKIYIYVSPTKFPQPYGSHPNFVDPVSGNQFLVKKLRELDNVVFWSFGDTEKGKEWFQDWGAVHTVPLAYDHLNYKRILDKNYEFDVCYVGGWANNGFNTKREIMQKHFAAFKKSGLKCGFFINKGLTNEQEGKVLTNSKVCINIHDEYQRRLQLDTNERTWKTLGINGLLVTDRVGDCVPDIHGLIQTDSPEEMVEKVREMMSVSPDIAAASRDFIMTNHTYMDRCQHLESL